MHTIDYPVSNARASIALFGGADGIYVRVAGLSVGPQGAAGTDASTAEALAATINADSAMSGVVSASAVGPVVVLVAVAPGAGGNLLEVGVETVVAGAALASPFGGGVSATFTL